jgi:hypothetical protein
MKTWKWLYDPESPYNWRFFRNVIVKAAILFVALNLLFAVLNPLPALGRISAYNTLLPGRERLPYGDLPDQAYNLSLFQIDTMFASHKLAGTDKSSDEFRVLLIGDSSVWGILLEPEDTLAGQINRRDLRTANGRRVRAYNLGYPTMSLTKDLLLLDYALRYDPDLIVWPFTLKSFNRRAQLDSAIVQHNPDPTRDLIARYDLDLNPDDARFVDQSFQDQTIIGQRRALADLVRLQLYGVPWAITGIDQVYPDDYTRRAVDLEPDESWQGYTPEVLDELGLAFEDVVAFDVLGAGVKLTGEVPVLFVNEPMFISQGENSHIRYNTFFPIWAYDAYHDVLKKQETEHGWQVLDLWDAMPEVDCYTDSAVHLTPVCSARLAEIVGAAILQLANTGTLASPDAGS